MVVVVTAVAIPAVHCRIRRTTVLQIVNIPVRQDFHWYYFIPQHRGCVVVFWDISYHGRRSMFGNLTWGFARFLLCF